MQVRLDHPQILLLTKRGFPRILVGDGRHVPLIPSASQRPASVQHVKMVPSPPGFFSRAPEQAHVAIWGKTGPMCLTVLEMGKMPCSMCQIV